MAKIHSREVAISVYYALIQSHITYGIALWGSCTNTKMERVFKLQKRAIRYVVGIKSDESCRIHFKNLGVLTVPSLYILEVCTYVKKNTNKIPKLDDNHTYDTRHRDRFQSC